jgi:hypothetical protein
VPLLHPWYCTLASFLSCPAAELVVYDDLLLQVAALNAGQLTWVPPQANSSAETQPNTAATATTSGTGSVLSLDLYYDTLLQGFERLIAGSKGGSQPGG